MTIESIHFKEVLDMLGADRQAVSSLLIKFSDELASDVAANEAVWSLKQRVMVGQARRVRDDIVAWIAAS